MIRSQTHSAQVQESLSLRADERYQQWSHPSPRHRISRVCPAEPRVAMGVGENDLQSRVPSSAPSPAISATVVMSRKGSSPVLLMLPAVAELRTCLRLHQLPAFSLSSSDQSLATTCGRPVSVARSGSAMSDCCSPTRQRYGLVSRARSMAAPKRSRPGPDVRQLTASIGSPAAMSSQIRAFVLTFH